MPKRKCFCSDCNGKYRSWNTVKRHRTLHGIVPCGPTNHSERDTSEKNDFKGCEGSLNQEDCSASNGKKFVNIAVLKGCEGSVNNDQDRRLPDEEFVHKVPQKGCEGPVSQGDVCSSDEDFISKVDLKVKYCKVEISDDSETGTADDESNSSDVHVGIEEKCQKSEDHSCLQESEQDLPNYCHQDQTLPPQPLEAQSEPESILEAENYSIIVKWICHILIKLKVPRRHRDMLTVSLSRLLMTFLIYMTESK